MAMEAVVGGDDDDRTVVDAFVEWLLSPIADAIDSIADSTDSADRPLPFPQNRRGERHPSI